MNVFQGLRMVGLVCLPKLGSSNRLTKPTEQVTAQKMGKCLLQKNDQSAITFCIKNQHFWAHQGVPPAAASNRLQTLLKFFNILDSRLPSPVSWEMKLLTSLTQDFILPCLKCCHECFPRLEDGRPRPSSQARQQQPPHETHRTSDNPKMGKCWLQKNDQSAITFCIKNQHFWAHQGVPPAAASNRLQTLLKFFNILDSRLPSPVSREMKLLTSLTQDFILPCLKCCHECFPRLEDGRPRPSSQARQQQPPHETHRTSDNPKMGKCWLQKNDQSAITFCIKNQHFCAHQGVPPAAASNGLQTLLKFFNILNSRLPSPVSREMKLLTSLTQDFILPCLKCCHECFPRLEDGRPRPSSQARQQQPPHETHRTSDSPKNGKMLASKKRSICYYVLYKKSTFLGSSRGPPSGSFKRASNPLKILQHLRLKIALPGFLRNETPNIPNPGFHSSMSQMLPWMFSKAWGWSASSVFPSSAAATASRNPQNKWQPKNGKMLASKKRSICYYVLYKKSTFLCSSRGPPSGSFKRASNPLKFLQHLKLKIALPVSRDMKLPTSLTQDFILPCLKCCHECFPRLEDGRPGPSSQARQ